MLTVEPFNGPWTGIVVVLAAGGAVAHYALRRRSFRVKRAWLLGIALFTVASSLTFQIAFPLNPPAQGWPLLENLPLHFCSLASLAMPFAVWFDWKPLRSVLFYPGTIAGLATLVSARPQEQGHPLLDPRSFFWVAHELNAIVPILLVSLALYRPTARQVLTSVGWLVAFVGIVIVPIDLAMRAWVDPAVNYFYLFDPEGADVLVLLWGMIPVPALYLVPVVILAIPVMYGQYAVYRLLTRGRQPAPIAPALA